MSSTKPMINTGELRRIITEKGPISQACKKLPFSRKYLYDRLNGKWSSQFPQHLVMMRDMGYDVSGILTQHAPTSAKLAVLTKNEEKNDKENKPMNKQTLTHFGFFENPFAHDAFEGHFWKNTVLDDVANTIIEYATNRRFLVVSGHVGAGKSTLVSHVRQTLDAMDNIHVYQPDILDIENVDPNWIQNGILQEIGQINTQKVCYKEHRTNKLRALMKSITDLNGTIVILVDEGDSLALQTIKTLKRFWEGTRRANTHIGVILIGKPRIHQILANPELEEVAKRVQILKLRPFYSQVGDKWIKKPEYIADYIAFKLSLVNTKTDIFTTDAKERIALRCETPLDVNNLATKALMLASQVGATEVTGEIIDAA